MPRQVKLNDLDFQFLEYVYDSDGKIICLRCASCTKFIARDWDNFYCPHCEVSFMDNVTTEDQKCTENLINYIEDLERLINDDNFR